MRPTRGLGTPVQSTEQSTSPNNRPRRHVQSPIQLGTVLQKALTAVGVTEERVRSLFGECGCKRRAQRLNELSNWAWGFLHRQQQGEENIEAKGKEEIEKLIAESGRKR